MNEYLNNGIGRFLLSIVCRMSKSIVVLTPWWEKLFLAKYPWLSKKIIVCPNSVDKELLDLSKIAKCNQKQSKDKVILSMSRVEIGKGFDKVLEAMSILPDEYKLKIAGLGEQVESLKEKTKKLGLSSRVEFLGWVDKDNKIKLLNEADVFCLPSKLDSFGMVYIEAMAAGLPVVALNFQSIPDVVEHEYTGILCDDDSPHDLAKAIVHAYSHRYEYGSNGKLTVIDKFDPAGIVNPLYGKLMGDNK